MISKSIKMTALVLLGVLLATLPGLVGCSEDKTEGKPEVIIGFLGDLTGPGAFAVVQTYDGLRDYLRMIEEEDLVPEVTMRCITYDSRGDRGRVSPGYKWLVGQGADLIVTISGDEAAIIESQLKADRIPDMSTQASTAIFGSEWAYGMLPPPASQGEFIMHWIGENWDVSTQGRAKIGFVGLGPLVISREMLRSVEEACQTSSDVFDWVGAEMVPYGTVAWAAEIAKLKNSDFVVCTAIGSSMATFIREARNRGFEGQFVGCMESLLAFWGLVRGAVPPESLDGAICSDPYLDWQDDVPWVATLREFTEKWYSSDEAAYIYMHTGRFGGWCDGTIIEEATKLAIAAVGAENVDGAALRDGLASAELTIEGFGNTWKVGGGINCYLQTVRMMRYDAAEDKWVPISEWYTPASLGG